MCRPQPSRQETNMFIAMNRFRVAKGSEAAFEQVWMSRDSHLDKIPGFVEFHLLKGPEAEDHTLYASHTVWENRAVFETWTKSVAFRAAHSKAGISLNIFSMHNQWAPCVEQKAGAIYDFRAGKIGQCQIPIVAVRRRSTSWLKPSSMIICATPSSAST